jgi:RNA polymerase subunit RPABC4/transcription elongation factor Spt4
MDIYSNNSNNSLIKKACEKCGKIVARYYDKDSYYFEVAEICPDCYKNFKKEVELLLSILDKRKSDKVDIYE